jgi:hypothetical protein
MGMSGAKEAAEASRERRMGYRQTVADAKQMADAQHFGLAASAQLKKGLAPFLF